MLHLVCRLVFILCVLSKVAFAGPPFVTDDPEPVEYRQWEINYGVAKTWAKEESSAAIPGLDINYGFSSDLQLHIQPRYTFVTGHAQNASGFDNTEVGVKYRFVHIDESGSSFMAGIYPMVQLPTGNEELGESSGKTQVFLPIWFQENIANWVFYGGSGYRFNRGSNSKNSVFSGAVVLYRCTDKMQLGGELFHESATAKGEHSSSGFNLGGIYSLSDDRQFLFSAGQGINDSVKNNLSVYLAYHATY